MWRDILERCTQGWLHILADIVKKDFAHDFLKEHTKGINFSVILLTFKYTLSDDDQTSDTLRVDHEKDGGLWLVCDEEDASDATENGKEEL